ncbi:MAG: helix-turn-helix domain-containing protein [Candidatus Sumerlaeota bacterium]|nr:helix-turn-helix domain-containing protein [Candidatus Sumerlaeota bacterium]
MESSQKFLLETEAADLLRLSVKTMRCWRLQGRGPHFSKFGRSVRYSAQALADFVADAERTSTSDTGAACSSGGECRP